MRKFAQQATRYIRPEGYRNILDFEFLGLRKDAGEVLRVANETDTETRACGPSTTRRVHFGGTQSAINESSKNLLILTSLKRL